MRKFASLLLLMVWGIASPTWAASETDPGLQDSGWDKQHHHLIQNCLEPSENEQVIYGEDVPFQSITDLSILQDRFNRLYYSEKRLNQRFYFDPQTGRVLAPIAQHAPAEVHPRFVESISAHIQYALKRTYAHFPYFSDMGHNHFFIPPEKWNQVYAPLAIAHRTSLYTKLMADSEIKMLYHTAEQLTVRGPDNKLISDPVLQWRFFTRNVVGQNNGQGHLEILFNTDLTGGNAISSYDDYKYYGAGVYLHANKNGCFSYQHKGETFYFDLGYEYFPYKNGIH